MYAVISAGGKQYKVYEGDTLFVEKLPNQADDKVCFDKVVLFSGDDEFLVGKPYVEGVSVEATVVKQTKARKIIVFKYNAKKNYRKKQGHRQPYTKLQISKIARA